jgi:hypothetical protein
MIRFNLTKLNETEHKEVSNRFAAWEILATEVDINNAWEISEKTSNFQPKQG